MHASITFNLAVEEININITDKYYRMLSHIVPAFKKRLRNKNMHRIQERKTNKYCRPKQKMGGGGGSVTTTAI